MLGEQSDQIGLVDRALDTAHNATGKAIENLSLARMMQSPTLSTTWKVAVISLFFLFSYFRR